MKGTVCDGWYRSIFVFVGGDGTKRTSNPLISMLQWQNHFNSTVKRAKSENERFIEENEGNDKFRVDCFDEK